MCGPDQAACGLVIESVWRYCPHMTDLASRPVTETEEQEGDCSPMQVVEQFLDLLCAEDIEGASDLLAEDVEYVNVGLPAVHGRERVRRLLHATLGRAGAGFEVYTHTISANGPSVLTERTDVLLFRRLRIQFWVCGRFDVRDGQVVLWRDYFSLTSYTAATLRGLLGVIIPGVSAKPPAA
jgi:limonene-1,2-epoxide hydrolase